MVWKNLFFINALRTAFLGSTPVAVELPKAVYMDFKDAGRLLMSYEVEVKYDNNVKRVFTFSVEERKLGIVPRRVALKRAIDFYRKKKAEIEKNNKKAVNQQVR